MGPVRIVTTTSTCLDPDHAARLGITLVPLHVVIDGRQVRDLFDIAPADVYRQLRRGVALTTAAPSPGEYLEAFESQPGPVLCLTEAAHAANVTVRITGSTAFRAATTNAIKNVLSSGNPSIAFQAVGERLQLGTGDRSRGDHPSELPAADSKWPRKSSVSRVRPSRCRAVPNTSTITNNPPPIKARRIQDEYAGQKPVRFHPPEDTVCGQAAAIARVRDFSMPLAR